MTLVTVPETVQVSQDIENQSKYSFELPITPFFLNRRTLPPSKTIKSGADPSSDRPGLARCQPWNSASQVVQGPRIRLGSIEKVKTEEEIFGNNGKIREDGT